MSEATVEQPPSQNSVVLCGRLTSAPLERELPSGDRILTFRLSMPRSRTTMTAKSKQNADWVDCVAWSGRTRRTASRWRVGDLVEIEGALRRRFFRAGQESTTRVEVEVLAARAVRRPGG
ncbi:MAG TPA: single-stranded DNA-binding protein [Nocardioidaceae bacterium]|nr:single-stranded DNA-binding protein [Nocardioidaceae bacterium]HSE69337.1 single-stranded DNA-binding protein [Nocardioidaceae bacterium]